APSRVATRIAGTDIVVDEVTDYPFGDTFHFRIQVAEPVIFSLTLRVPYWCTHADATVNGEPQPGFDRAGFSTIRREWRRGDVVDVHFPVALQTREGRRGAISIQRGPLTFSLRIGERWQKLPARQPSTEPFADWEVYPTTPWNYALVVDPIATERHLEVKHSPIGALPFAADAPPIQIRAKARVVPHWAMDGLSAGPTPPSPIVVETPIEDVTLVPYGCARLRVTELPY